MDRRTQQPPASTAALTAGHTGWSTVAEPALGLRPLHLVDGPLGLVSPTFDERDTALLLPSGIALGATWDEDTVRAVATAQASEARRRGYDAVYAPNLNLARTGLSGRTFEMLSEDPHLAGVLGAAYVTGLQGQGVAAVPKHLVCNDTETARQRMSADIGETALREVYLRPFELAVRAGAWGLMAAYNRLNGTPCTAHAELLAIVKGEWGFDGVVVSDYFALQDTLGPALAGLDLEMPGPAIHFGDRLAEAVERGDVPRARLDDAVDRLLRLARRVGAVEGSERQVTAADAYVPPDQAEAALVDAAAASFVLARNEDDLLPLDPRTIRRLAVIGPNADRPCYQGATFGRIRPARDAPTPLQALRERFGPHCEIVHERGVDTTPAASLGAFRVTAPDGTPGVLLEHVRGGRTVLEEVRGDSAFIWFGEVPGAGPTAEPGVLRLTAVFTPDTGGEWTLGAGGSGTTVLSVDGRVLAERKAPAPQDVMGQVARAETSAARVELRAGEPVTVTVEMASGEGARVQALTVTCAPPARPGALERARRAAAEADAVVLVVGDELETSRESKDLDTSELPSSQTELIGAVSASNPRTAVVVNAGRPVHAPWADGVAAVVQGWFAGQGFGTALARVLAGDAEPGGRMPVTVPRADADRSTHGEHLDTDLRRDYDAAEPTGYRHLARTGTTARFPFGSGRGYTTWRFGDAGLHRDGARWAVRLDVTNTGRRPGREVVQVYVRAPGETDLRLAGFTGVRLDAGATAEAEVALDDRAWQRWAPEKHGWVAPPGPHEVLVGRSVEEIVQVLVHEP
ncbi:beta-glucosidase [Streptomyces sp. SDT5-1]|uniref:beta-glucosidase family protein n=1 Tax=Streptomyces sp. SDT5-1 TaxID=3406418 RepID=UPI003FD48E00